MIRVCVPSLSLARKVFRKGTAAPLKLPTIDPRPVGKRKIVPPFQVVVAFLEGMIPGSSFLPGRKAKTFHGERFGATVRTRFTQTCQKEFNWKYAEKIKEKLVPEVSAVAVTFFQESLCLKDDDRASGSHHRGKGTVCFQRSL